MNRTYEPSVPTVPNSRDSLTTYYLITWASITCGTLEYFVDLSPFVVVGAVNRDIFEEKIAEVKGLCPNCQTCHWIRVSLITSRCILDGAQMTFWSSYSWLIVLTVACFEPLARQGARNKQGSRLRHDGPVNNRNFNFTYIKWELGSVQKYLR